MKRTNNLAFVIGCRRYKRLEELLGVEHDVHQVSKALEEYCYCSKSNIHSLVCNYDTNLCPTGADIIASLGSFLDSRKHQHFDNLFFYYSGHGCMVDEDLFIMPPDVTTEPVTHGHVATKTIKSITDRFSNFEKVVFIFDMCQTGLKTKSLSEYDILSLHGSSVTFYSCAPNSKSYMIPSDRGDGSIFTTCLCEALATPNVRTVREVSDELRKRIVALCKELRIDQCPHTEIDDTDLADMILTKSKRQSSSRNKATIKPLETDEASVSIWLKDAELADGDQARFRTFTTTPLVTSFIKQGSPYYGIASVKGIGKTFLLQIRRTGMTRSALCFPYYEKPGKDNNWATESISFGSDSIFRNNETHADITNLWKYTLITYISHCWLSFQRGLPSQKRVDYQEITKWINEALVSEDLSKVTYRFLMGAEYGNLTAIIQDTLKLPDWISFVESEYAITRKLMHLITQAQWGKKSRRVLALFIDKLDNAMHQPISEELPNCEQCSKQKQVSICSNPKKGSDFCTTSGAHSCNLRDQCCYGCFNYVDEYAGIYAKTSSGGHNSYWQRIQLSLIEAVSDIQTDFSGRVKVIYTVRLEAFNTDAHVFGENRAKIMGRTLVLKYDRREQFKIYRDCIRNQHDSFLFDPSLKNKDGDEDEAFVGVKSICHPYVSDTRESIFDIIYRHSFDRTRDIQDYCNELTLKMDDIRDAKTEEERATVVKRVIEETAARLAFCSNPAVVSSENSYYYEKVPNLPTHWADRNNFAEFIRLIDRNLLFADDIRKICRKVNGKTLCPSRGCTACNYHPFSMLQKLGMLGRLVLTEDGIETVSQSFLSSSDITYIHDEDSLFLNDHSMYLIHPALTKSIEALQNGDKIMHFKGFLIGRDIIVHRSTLLALLEDRSRLSSYRFDRKYYQVFRS